ncbi:hypothetical protein ACJA88_006977 [Fusarium oxysporum]
MDQADIPALLARMASDEDASRKMAVFKLQNSINDPAFADVFISSGGLVVLRRLIMTSAGNTLAYSLQSLTRLLEVDMGWDIFEGPTASDLVERVVELIVTNPLVNILRGAMSILVALVGEDWAKFIKRLQDLGLIKAVHRLMQSSALQDLAHPMLEFQTLTKILLRKWREVDVDLERPEHRRALKGLHLASAPERAHVNGHSPGQESHEAPGKKGSRRHNPEKWRRLGFETESPAQEFDMTGFLGMMDLTDYVRRNEDGFQKLLLEQAGKPTPERCPVARASFAVTMILYDHFDVDKTDLDDVRGYQLLEAKDHDRLFRPLLLQWSRLHTAGLYAFFRVWKLTGAEQGDFEKVVELVRILIDCVVGGATRTKDVAEVEEEMQEYDVPRLREQQMGLLEMSFESTWGQHLQQVREELKQEALQFVKEQRIRCLLQGSWFSKPTPKRDNGAVKHRLFTPTPWRYAKLSHNRRYLHYADFEEKTVTAPSLDSLGEKVDLSTISSVVSNVSAPNEDTRSTMSDLMGKDATPKTTTKITVYSFVNPTEAARGTDSKEQPIFTLWPLSHSLASEWLDGLLMLLNQAPITAETNKLVNLVSEYGLKIRLLNVRMDTAFDGPEPGAGVIPSRDGLDEDYFFEV